MIKIIKITNASIRAKKKYNDAHYSSLQVHLNKNLVASFKSVVAENGIYQTDVISYFITAFIANTDEYLEKINSDIYKNLKGITEIDAIRLQSQAAELLAVSDEKELHSIIHSDGHPRKRIKVAELRALIKYFGLKVENDKSRTELMYVLHGYLLNRLKCVSDT